MPYLLIKAAHVAAVLLFIAGLFSQTFALAAAQRGDALAPVRYWDSRVTTPAMLIVWLTGATMAAQGGWFASPWLWAKLALVVALTGLHGVQYGQLRRLQGGNAVRVRIQPGRVAALVAASSASIAFLVVVKPF